jgi:exodeoxyribonuclease VII large subunit
MVRVHPRQQLREKVQYLDDLQSTLVRCVRQGWRERQVRWHHFGQRLSRLKPSAVIALRWQALRDLARRLSSRTHEGAQRKRSVLQPLQARLRLLGPENVLARGYSITTDAATGNVIRDDRDVRPNQRLKTRLKAGEVWSIVENPTRRPEATKHQDKSRK